MTEPRARVANASERVAARVARFFISSGILRARRIGENIQGFPGLHVKVNRRGERHGNPLITLQAAEREFGGPTMVVWGGPSRGEAKISDPGDMVATLRLRDLMALVEMALGNDPARYRKSGEYE